MVLNMKKRYIEISKLPNFEITANDGQKFVLLPFEHLYDIPEANVIESAKCKDCVMKHYSGQNLWCDIFDKIMPEDGFCCFADDGTRKE